MIETLLCSLVAGPLKTTPSIPAEPLAPKRTAQSLYHIFNSNPISTCFKRAIFKEKPPSNLSQHLEAPNHSEHKENHEISSPQKNTEVPSCLKQAAADASSETKAEPLSLAPGPPSGAVPPSCESEADHLAEDETDVDQTIFFTPELFEDEEDEGDTKKETGTESPARVVSGTESSALLLEELFSSEQAQGQGQASAFDGQGAISVSKESTELTQGRAEERGGQKQGEEGDKEEVDNQSRQACSRLRRLSRSRHKLPATPTGN